MNSYQERMFRINIFLMLTAIIPYLDCCSSFTIFNRKSLYNTPSLELQIRSPVQLQKNHNNNVLRQQNTSPPPPPNHSTSHLLLSPEHGELKTTKIWHKQLLHLNIEVNKNSSESNDENFESKKSLKLKTQEQEQEDKLKQKLANNVSLTNNKSTIHNQPEHDAQYKLISEIVSLECVDFLKLEFCLNGGRCFLYPILNHSLSSCECAEGFVGERCEAKSYEFIPRIRPRLVLAKTKGGPLMYGLAFVDIIFLLFLFCKNYTRD